jgi:hypothetical protein
MRPILSLARCSLTSIGCPLVIIAVASLVSLAAPAAEQKRPQPETNITTLLDKYLSADAAIAFTNYFASGYCSTSH